MDIGPLNAAAVTVPPKVGELATARVALPEVAPPVRLDPATTAVISPLPSNCDCILEEAPFRY